MKVQIGCQGFEFLKRKTRKGVSNGVFVAENVGSVDDKLMLGGD